MSQKMRLEHDSMGELQVPADALYGAQTQRALENFSISAYPMPHEFITALALIKAAVASANGELGHLSKSQAAAITKAAEQVANGQWREHFPVEVFQTGSGTSSNMNANEVIASLASKSAKLKIHPNDHVNAGQSSNDVIPSAIHVSTNLLVHKSLLPALRHLRKNIDKRARELSKIIKTGRTHLMDAMPLSFEQELSGWSAQITSCIERFEDTSKRLQNLPLGGTAIGTGINADPKMPRLACQYLKKQTGVKFSEAKNKFECIAAQDHVVELSGQCTALAACLMKISNDLRWMNSGPLAGLGEIELKALQPGSSIMPGKVNPVIPEAVAMVCAQVMGNHTTIMIAGQSGNFQLNVMLPIIAHNILESLRLLSSAATSLADKAIAGFTVRTDRIAQTLDRNPILVTALNPIIGYEKAAAIAKRAYKERRPVLDVAIEMTDLGAVQLRKLLDPKLLV
ncbi:MAG: class II fumarate hydratase [Arenimonas sp.]